MKQKERDSPYVAAEEEDEEIRLGNGLGFEIKILQVQARAQH